MSTTDREIAATRVFDAPRDRVFQMWDPTRPLGEELAKRWFSVTSPHRGAAAFVADRDRIDRFR